MSTRTPPCDAGKSALLADFYQFTMLQAYHAAGMRGTASFELFFRRLPAHRSFVMVAGLEPVLEWLETLHLTREELDWLRASGRFDGRFLAELADLRFTGDVDAVPEGLVVFAEEPVLRVSAPIAQAQLIESRLMNLMHYQSAVASKAARCVLAADTHPLIEFGTRRAPGAEAALMAARAAMVAGFAGTSNALAGMRFGLPVTGTMAHSFVQAHEVEALAFEHFALVNPDRLVLLIDTYDTEQGAHRAVAVAQQLAERGIRLEGVRLDSGDLGPLSRRVRGILDAAGLNAVKILASGDLDEWRITELRGTRAAIDVYCVGTTLTTVSDAPCIDFAYKLVDYEGRPCQKRSMGKATMPGRKQVWRQFDAQGRIVADLICLAEEPEPESAQISPSGLCRLTGLPPGQAHLAESSANHQALDPAPQARAEGPRAALLDAVMRGGRRTRPAPSLTAMQACAAAALASLPEPLRALEGRARTTIRVSNELLGLTAAGRLACQPRAPTRTPCQTASRGAAVSTPRQPASGRRD